MIRANEKKEKVTTFIEEWVGHFGSSDERENETRELCFNENTMDVADQISSCLKGISVIPEAFTECCLTREEQNGLCLITQIITESACKALDFLVEDRQSVTGRNGTLRREMDSLQAEKEQLEQRVKQAEKAAEPGILQTLQSVESTLNVCVSFMNAVKNGTYGQDANNVYSDFINKLTRIDVQPSDVIDHLAKAGHEAIPVMP